MARGNQQGIALLVAVFIRLFEGQAIDRLIVTNVSDGNGGGERFAALYI